MSEIDQLLIQFGLGAYFVHLIERLKSSQRFAWITPYSDVLNKVIAAVYGFIIAAGLTVAFVPSGDGYAAFTLGHIPVTPSMIWQALTHAFGQYFGQKFYYLSAVKPNQDR